MFRAMPWLPNLEFGEDYPRYSGPTMLVVRCGARAVNVQISVGSSQLFWDEAFVVLTNYHNGMVYAEPSIIV